MAVDGKVVLITGGGTGIGRASAELLVERGARVMLGGRREDPLREAVAALGEERAAWRTADLREDAGVRALVAAAVERFGRLDAVVNAAGQAAEWAPVHETPDAAWDAILDVNLSGAFRVARASLPHLVESRGALVLVSSISALRGANSVASYAAAKAGLHALTRVIAAEYGWQGVRCTCVVPSWVDTPMTHGFLADAGTREDVGRRHALQRVATAREIAETIVFLASDAASFVTGSVHLVDGGMAAL